MPRHQGLYYQQWAKCDRCYFDFPIGSLSMQNGLLLDAKCFDNMDVEYRPKIIAEVLADEQETTNELTNVADDPNALEF